MSDIRGDHIHDRFGRRRSHRRVLAALGDSDGDGNVDGLDRDAFRSKFNSSVGELDYLWYLDIDGDGNVDGWDQGHSIAGSTTAINKDVPSTASCETPES